MYAVKAAESSCSSGSATTKSRQPVFYIKLTLIALALAMMHVAFRDGLADPTNRNQKRW